MPTDFFKIFTSLGLSNIETRVYLAAFELGPTSVQDIAKQAKLSRTATYDAVKLLQDRGLMSTYESGKKRFFASEDPERAVTHFKQTVANMESQLGVLDRSLGEMKMLAGGDRPTVRFYEGKEAMFAVFSDVDKANPSFIYEVTNVDDVYTHLNTETLYEARKLLGSRPVHMLMTGTLRNPLKTVKARRISAALGNYHGDIWIYGNRVVFVTFIGKIVTVIIENETFSQTAKVLFEAAWACSEEVVFEKK